MNPVPVLNFQDFISVDGEALTTDSRKVAAFHGKQHAKVLALIRQRITEAGEWGVANFGETSFIGANGEVYPAFSMTKNGYAFLVGRLTGKKAVEHQIAYIEAFDAMAAYLKNQRDGLRYRCMEKELECKDSFRRGSYHGKGLNQRKQEKPLLDGELASLMEQAQRPLHLV